MEKVTRKTSVPVSLRYFAGVERRNFCVAGSRDSRKLDLSWRSGRHDGESDDMRKVTWISGAITNGA